jgi:hypothetical protein
VSGGYLPSGGKIKDPSKLQASEVDSLLQFWGARQDAGEDSVFLFRQWQDKDKKLRRPVKDHSTDESGSEAPSRKPTKTSRQVALPTARVKGKRRSTNRHVVVSDSDSDSDLDENPRGKSVPPEGKSTLHLSSIYLTNTLAVVPPPKPVGKSGQQQKSLPAPPVAAQSKPAPRPVPVKRKRVVDTDHGSQDGDRPTKKAKPSKPATVDPVPPAITASRPRSFGPRSSGKRQKKDKILDSDVPARRTRSKVTDEQPKGMQTRQTRK